MSLKINIDSLTDTQKEQIVTELTITPDVPQKFKTSFYATKSPPVELFQIDGDDVIVPFSYGISKMGMKKPKSDKYKKQESGSFTGSLRDTQKDIKDEAISLLNTNGATLISCYPGFGKTITAIYIASKIKLQTLIIVHRVVLVSQWEKSIKTFCPNAKITILNPASKKLDINADFFIVNAINVGKFSGSTFLSSIGTVIVDEAHLIMSKILSQSLRFLFPKYLIGLSATPYRSDGLNILLDHYFTPHKIVRKLVREHLVYKVNTGFTPEIDYDRNGKVNWSSVLESQSNNRERNNLILSLVKKHSDRIFLILTKRVEQAKYLFQQLKAMNESVAILVESDTEFDRECRILIGTTSKAGVGFDHDKLDALILASDLEEYFIQYLGRVFRRLDMTPIVFDLVDDNPILKRHFSTRKAVYLETGGKIESYKL